MKLKLFLLEPAVIAVFAFIIYSNTLNHQYALDDSMVITENRFTKKGLGGLKDIFTTDSFEGFFKQKKELVQGGRYRPLSIATFAVEYHFFGLKPSLSHFINIIFYGLTGIMVWLVLKKLILGIGENHYLKLFPFIAAMLFIFHPVHTEVVANIKGRDEILALLFSLGALNVALKFSGKNNIMVFVLMAAGFFLALLSKENAVTFMVYIPLVLVLVKDVKPNKGLVVFFALSVVFALWFLIRIKAAGGLKHLDSAELMNNPFLHATVSQKYATIVHTLGIYIKLLFFPHPLTFDYYPYHISLQQWNFLNIIILLVYLALLAWLVFLLKYTSKNKTFSLVFFAMVVFLGSLFLVSNIPFDMGTFMNERFLYFPSLGFCIVIAWLILKIAANFKNPAKVSVAILLVFLLPFGAKTMHRNRAWKNNTTLFTTDVITSSNSAKSNCSTGGVIYENTVKLANRTEKMTELKRASGYLQRALQIHPEYADAWRLLGNVNHEMENYTEAIGNYLKVFETMPDDAVAWQNTDVTLSKFNSADEKIAVYEKLHKIKPLRFETNYQLGNLYGKHKNNLPKAVYYLEMAVKIDPQSFEANKDLGVAYGISGQFQKSADYLNKALILNPGDADTYFNLGITYYNLKDTGKANEYFQKGKELKTSDNE
ncbi:MAG: tetratricopeptide repeat protein [Bacteroidales bacterium]|nr:tetratricopeptide repeat protein [Bacteroidales bacterium]